MNAVIFISVLTVSISPLKGLVIFANHRYGHVSKPSSFWKKYSSVQQQMLKERQEQLSKFVGDFTTANQANEFKPKNYIRPGDVVGLLPSKAFKIPHKEDSTEIKNSTSATGDSETGESQSIPKFSNAWSNSYFTPESITNHKYGGFDIPHGNVRVHTYRGPAKKYWVLHHKAEEKTYTPWGYYVKQPVDYGHYKFHSPLKLSFQYD